MRNPTIAELEATAHLGETPAAEPVGDPLDFSDIPTPQAIEGPRLTDILATARTHKGRFMTFVEPMLTLRQLEPFLDLLNAASAEFNGTSTSGMLAMNRKVASHLLWVQEAERLRPATQDELLDNFGLDLPGIVTDILQHQGITPSAEGEAAAPSGAGS